MGCNDGQFFKWLCLSFYVLALNRVAGCEPQHGSSQKLTEQLKELDTENRSDNNRCFDRDGSTHCLNLPIARRLRIWELLLKSSVDDDALFGPRNGS
jgi:hypothetical protein